MPRFQGTKVIQNHKPGESDVRAGWLVRSVTAAGLGLLTLVAQRAFVMSAQMEVLVKTVGSLKESADQEQAAREQVAKELRDHREATAAQHGSFVTRDELEKRLALERRLK